MARGFPQAAVEQQRSLDLVVAGGVEPRAQVVFDHAKQRPPFRMPEDAADSLLTQMEQLELAPKPPMVTALGFFEPEEILIEFLLVGPCRAVDALELCVLGIAPPIGARRRSSA